jgi:23S rRNA (adenine2503-C2)-methyltransferase
MDQVEAFQRVLHDAGYLCFIRRRRGDDVAAACGQLVMLGAEPNNAFRKRQPS